MQLTQWPIDRISRKRPELRRNALVLVSTIRGREFITAICPRARQSGIREGMTLAEARAVCPGLQNVIHDLSHDQRVLEALGRWMMRFSPVVSLDCPNALMLDVTGCERLYGGFMNNLLWEVKQALWKLKINARLCIAPTVGAAWAGAAYGNIGLIPHDGIIDALAPLPPAALRIDPGVSIALGQLGIETISQLMKLARQSLPARFGPQLLKRLDAAIGLISEPLVVLEYHAEVSAKIEFEDAISSIEAIWQVFHELLDQIIFDLTSRGCGARVLRAIFCSRHSIPVVKTIRLSRASRKAPVLFNLLRCALESVRSNEGFTEIRLEVPVFESLEDAQLNLYSQSIESDDDLAELIDALRARLGPDSIVQAQLIESHLPEQAYRDTEAHNGPCSVMTKVRPLRLMPAPAPISVTVFPLHGSEGMPISFTRDGKVHRLNYADGPERIRGPWWEGRHKTRDYFDVEDDTGERFWLFRVLQTEQWYLHGFFA